MQRFSFSLFVLLTIGLIACSPMVKLAKAQTSLLQDTALKGAHLGVAVYDPATSKYLYNYQGDHYFTPASNTKLFTCYAAMKYLGDSLVGARYKKRENDLLILPAGDPTFLHPDYDFQPLFQILKSQGEKIVIRFFEESFYKKKYGPGWSWDDYETDYMPERSPFPIYGNVVWFGNSHLSEGKAFSIKDTLIKNNRANSEMDRTKKDSAWVQPAFFARNFYESNWWNDKKEFHREERENSFYSDYSNKNFTSQQIPFITFDKDGNCVSCEVLESIIQKPVVNKLDETKEKNLIVVHSQPTDSLLRPMMHRSDNFFAEQSLLMVSNEKLGFMNDEAIIDTLLNTDLKDLPQKPVWVDGSGLSRYNLFTPQDFVTLLLKMKNEFGIERIKNILPKGNTGTLTNYYQKLGTNIFAKTGSLSGQIALSGYLICKSGKLLLFSVIVNNHNSSGRAVRRAVEKFVTEVWEKN